MKTVGSVITISCKVCVVCDMVLYVKMVSGLKMNLQTLSCSTLTLAQGSCLLFLYALKQRRACEVLESPNMLKRPESRNNWMQKEEKGSSI